MRNTGTSLQPGRAFFLLSTMSYPAAFVKPAAAAAADDGPAAAAHPAPAAYSGLVGG
ncbi:MAG: hypothetical protein U0736_04810 [Gemmataceae bacterium]